MISPLPGWSWSPIIDGVVLRADDAPEAAAIRYRERVRPVRSLAELVHADCTAPDFEVDRIHGPELITTDEGECAAIVTVSARRAGEPVQRSLGYVWGDDFCAHVSGLALSRRHFATVAEAVRTLVRSDCHMLGVRPRRFRYQAPADWRGSSRGSLFHHYWAAPEGDALLTVYPAWPAPAWDRASESQLAALHGRAEAGLAIELEGGPAPVRTRTLDGQVWSFAVRAGDARLVRTLVILRDDRYLYPLVIDAAAARWPETAERFAEVVESIDPLPRGAAAAGASHAVFACWVD